MIDRKGAFKMELLNHNLYAHVCHTQFFFFEVLKGHSFELLRFLRGNARTDVILIANDQTPCNLVQDGG